MAHSCAEPIERQSAKSRQDEIQPTSLAIDRLHYNSLVALAFLFIVYCFEAGIFFTVVPWTRFWSLNPILHYSPAITMIAENSWVRGLVSGFGVAHFFVGGRALYDHFLSGAAKRGRR